MHQFYYFSNLHVFRFLFFNSFLFFHWLIWTFLCFINSLLHWFLNWCLHWGLNLFLFLSQRLSFFHLWNLLSLTLLVFLDLFLFFVFWFVVHWFFKFLLLVFLFFFNLSFLFISFFTLFNWGNWTFFCVLFLFFLLCGYFLWNFLLFVWNAFFWFNFWQNIFFYLLLNWSFRLFHFRMLLGIIFLRIKFGKLFMNRLFYDCIKNLSWRSSFIQRRSEFNVHQFLLNISDSFLLRVDHFWKRWGFYALRNNQNQWSIFLINF